jgi:NSS family neurotransmitter:Na+ symporter
MGMTIAIVLGGVQNGIEMASRILMPALLLLMGGLMVYAFTLPAFGQAAGFLFRPNPDKLSARGVLEALGHSFFTLSVGWARWSPTAAICAGMTTRWRPGSRSRPSIPPWR